MKYATTAMAAITLFISGCVAGPNYQRPPIEPPATFRGADVEAGEASIADTRWSELFRDPVLSNLISTALRQNYDLQIATERVWEARAALGITDSDLYPSLDINGTFAANRNSQVGSIRFLPQGVNNDVSYTQAGFRIGWELDFWGRLRRLSEAARAEYLSTKEARHGVRTTVVADVTASYLTLRELDRELEVASKTAEIAQDSLRLTTLRQRSGAATGLDVRQAEQFLRSATAQIAASERLIAQQENALSLLLARDPGGVPRGKELDDLLPPVEVQAGLPSSLLERRPDIREAEQRLVSANAQIGAARALYFPQISLTTFIGGQSRALTDLFAGPAKQWNFNPLVNLPVFNTGRVRSNVRLTEAAQREALAKYQKTIQSAFREVSDALIAYHKDTEQLEQQQLLVKALQESSRLSLIRYQGGLDSYLQVLDAERNLFQGQLAAARLRRDMLLSVVELYRALGGGW
jgi:multidrug efflux system outer membrane protein